MCLSVREDISGTARAIFTNFLRMLSTTVARSFSGTLTIGRIAYRREGSDGSAQRRRARCNRRVRCCLLLTVPARIDGSEPLHVSVIVGESVALPCNATGTPRPRVTWQKGTRLLAGPCVHLLLSRRGLRPLNRLPNLYCNEVYANLCT